MKIKIKSNGTIARLDPLITELILYVYSAGLKIALSAKRKIKAQIATMLYVTISSEVIVVVVPIIVDIMKNVDLPFTI